MKPCDDIESQLPWLASGTLDRTEMVVVCSHVVTCADCRQSLVEWTQMTAWVQSAGQHLDPISAHSLLSSLMETILESPLPATEKVALDAGDAPLWEVWETLRLVASNLAQAEQSIRLAIRRAQQEILKTIARVDFTTKQVQS